jgi:hypothetical protein
LLWRHRITLYFVRLGQSHKPKAKAKNPIPLSSNTAAIDQYNQSGIVRILVIPRARARDLEVSPVLLAHSVSGRVGHGREGHGGNVGT